MNTRPLRPLRPSVRPSPIFLVILAITGLGGALAWISGAAQAANPPLAHAAVLIFVFAGWVVSLCLHEFGHAYTAWRFGDHEVAGRGYLTLNPLKYSNPMLSLGLPLLFVALGGIGLPGGAVWLRTGSMTKWQRTVVSLAGPFANLVLAVLLLGAGAVLATPERSVFWGGVAFLGLLQVMAVVLNVLPVPGLDGYGALEPHLSPQTQRALSGFKQWGVLLLVVVLLMSPLNQWFFGLVYRIFALLGGSGAMAAVGFDLALFWSLR
ncbi:site-2 protease family protein [Mycolicibacterium sp.]|uniref:site-2 protease family protein n=1 Tax=Mycolicibacterium sp. TaxID=2320850 RepID=UPI00355F32BC